MGDLEKIVLLVQNVILGGGIVGLALIGLIVVSRFLLGIVRSIGQQARRLSMVSLAVAGLLIGVFAIHGSMKNTNGVLSRTGMFWFPQTSQQTVVSLLPEGVESCFWHEQTASNSLILTWQNALYNRDVNCLTNFQAELFPDGSFVYRYPDHAVSYAPVFPFDWDGDGLENSVDPEPLAELVRPGPATWGPMRFARWFPRIAVCVRVPMSGILK